MLDELPNLSCVESNIIFEQEDEYSAIKVYENDNYRWLTLGSDLIQSLVSLADPDRVQLPYAHSMLLALIFKQQPLQLLNLGSGCGTFERFFFKCYPGASITSVESNIDIINISRKYFYMPAGYPVLNESADVFLKKNDVQHDIIFCDLHDGCAHPEYLFELDFYKNIERSLKDDGVFVMNIIPAAEKQLVNILLSIRKIFKWQYLLDFDRYNNILLYIFYEEPRLIDSNDAVCAALKENTGIKLTCVLDRLILLPAATLNPE